MSYLGDFSAGDTIDFNFTTRRFSTGAPHQLAGTPAVRVYKGSSTTEDDSGITLTVDFDSRTGLNHVTIDTSTDPTFYADGSQFEVVVTAGTVDSVSVVGEVVGRFTLRAQAPLYPTTAGRKLDVTATGAAGVDWGNVENQGTAVNLSATNIDSDQVVASIAGTTFESIHLDHLIASADPGSVVANNSFLAKLVSKSATAAFSSYDWTTDSLEALRDYAAPASTALTSATWTNARAGYLDNLNVGGLVASSAEATAIQNNTRVVRVTPDAIELPTSGTRTYRIELFLYDETGNMEAPDSAPTIALVNQAGTDRSSRLDSTTMALVETGRYRAIYTSTAGDTKEQLVWTFSVVEGGATRKYGNMSYVTDAVATDFTSSDRSNLDAIKAKTDQLAFSTANRVNAQVFGMENDTLTSGALAGSAVTEIQSGLSTLTSAQVTTVVQGVVETNNLDHLVKSAVDTNFATTVHSNSVIGHMAAVSASADFDRTTDSLEFLSGLASTAALGVGSLAISVTDIQNRLPAALVSGKMDSSVGAMQNNVITTAAINNGAITDAKFTTPAEAAGIPTTILAMMRRVFERQTRKRTRNRTTGVFALRNTADNADLETNTQSTSGTTDTIGATS